MLWILRTVLLAAVWVVMAAVLAVGFGVGYVRIVPTAQHHVDLHFDYTTHRQAHATAQFPAMLRANQQYRVALELTVPDILDSAPNFMVRAKLAHGPRTIATLVRPGLLRRRSWFVEIAFKASRLPLYLVGVLEETRTDTIGLSESFKESTGMPVTSVAVELWAHAADSSQSKVPDCYASRLVFAAQLTAIQSLLVRYKVVLFVAIVFGGASLLTILIAVFLVIKQLHQATDGDHMAPSIREYTDKNGDSTSDTSTDSEEYSAEEQLVPLL